MLEHAASFNGADAITRRGPGPSALGPAGSEPRSQTLTRRNTEAQRPSPLDIDNSAYPPTSRSNGPNSAAPGGPGAGGRNQYQDDTDEIEQYVNALSLDSSRKGGNQQQSSSSPSDLRVSPVPTRSNSNNSGSNLRPGMHRNQSHAGGQSPPLSAYDGTSSPNGRSGPGGNVAPAVAELRRMGSGARGLKREDSVRSTTSNGMYPGSSPLGYSNSVSGRSEECSYLDEPVYAGLRDKVSQLTDLFLTCSRHDLIYLWDSMPPPPK